MAEDLAAVVAGAIASSGDSGAADTGAGDVGTDTQDVQTESSGDTGTDVSTVADQAADTGTGTDQSVQPSADDVARRAEEDAFDRELEELGIGRPKDGKDNRIPYSRTRKIIQNAKKKWSDKLAADHKVELSAREKRIQEFETEQASWNAAEQLLSTDPERYLGTLAVLYPDQYRKYVQGGGQEQARVQQQHQQDQEPQPDVKYSDGSLGYSQAQFDALRQWDRREAARTAEEAFNKRFGGIERQHKEQQAYAQKLSGVRSDIDKLRDQWGADMVDNPETQKEIVAHMDANPKATLVAATRAVIYPKIQADRTKLRAELLKEIQAGAKAAVPAPTVSSKPADAPAGSLTDIVRNSIRGLKR